MFISRLPSVEKRILAVATLLLVLVLWQLGTGRWHLLLALPVLLMAAYLLWRDVAALWWLALAAVPLSVEAELAPGWALTLPTDAAALLLCLALLVLLLGGRRLHIQWYHPLTLLLLGYLAWMLLCCVTSTTPLRSLKQVAATAWMAAAFFILPQHILTATPRMQRMLAWVLAPVCCVAVYALLRHSATGFSFASSSLAMQPFYKDHGTYATALNFALLLLIPRSLQLRGSRRIGALGMVLVLGTAIVFSYTRGAWLGLATGLLLIGLVLLHRARPAFARAVAIVLVVGTGIFGTLVIGDGLKGSKDGARGISYHVLSSFYTEGNLSNQERVNRWVTAWDMLWQRPLMGWGPGAYTVQYAGHQQARYKTDISTNQGNRGGAHNEWLAAGTDAGLLGLLLWLGLFVTTLVLAVRGALRAARGELWPWLGIAAALSSYFVHAFLNNFMDQDKVGVPVLVMMAWLVVLGAQQKIRARQARQY